MKKLFIITIKEQKGYQMPMGIHAVTEFLMHSKKARKWYKKSNTVVCLSVLRNEFEYFKTELQKVSKVFVFKEPDLQNMETAFCFLSNKHTIQITKILPLALK
jgi:hypothetical protein